MWFVVEGKPLRFGMMEYALVTGLGCGEVPTKAEADAIRKSPGAKGFIRRFCRGQSLLQERF